MSTVHRGGSDADATCDRRPRRGPDSELPDHLDVLIVGAGLSGIAAAHYVQTDCPWATYAVVEARDALGGTWDLFRYPGIRSDSDMYTLGYSFRPWDRPDAIAEGGDILDYLHETVADEGIDDHLHFGRRVVAADYSSSDARWTVTLERGTGDRQTLTCGALFSCTGYYRYDRGHQPEFPGTDDFDGQLIDPQHWPEDLDYGDQKIVVIGSGATAVTLIPSLAEAAERVTMLQRSPSYVAALPRRNPLMRFLRAVLPVRWSGPATRWLSALLTQGSYRFCKRFPGAARRILQKGVAVQLPKGFDVEQHFSPAYDPWDQRLCLDPDGVLFRAIRRGRADVVTDTIDTFVAEGIRLASGEVLPADIVVSATGLELLFLGGMELTIDGDAVDPSEHLTYKGVMLEGVPNFGMAVGYTNASWTLKAELSCQVFCRILNHAHSTGQPSFVPRNTDPDISPEPMLGLSSGYIQRAADRFPRQGQHDPWRVHQSFWRDHRLIARSDPATDGIEFTGNQSRPTIVPSEPAAVA